MENSDKIFYTKHLINKDDIEFGKRILDYIESVLNNHNIETTDFLDPHQIKIAKSIINRFDLKYHLDGFGENRERKVLVMYHDYVNVADIEQPIELIGIFGDLRFSSIEHRDVLGSILNLGIKRSKIGDILFDEDKIQIIVTKKIKSYIEMNLERIGNTKVTCKILDSNEIIQTELEVEEKSLNLSSLRLDSIVAAICKISRSKSALYIKNEKVKLNWKIEMKTSLEIEVDDQISIRGFGRFKIKSFDGQTKKERYKITILKFI